MVHGANDGITRYLSIIKQSHALCLQALCHMNHAGQLERRQPENFIGQEDILYSFGGLTIASLDIEKINDF